MPEQRQGRSRNLLWKSRITRRQRFTRFKDLCFERSPWSQSEFRLGLTSCRACPLTRRRSGNMLPGWRPAIECCRFAGLRDHRTCSICLLRRSALIPLFALVPERLFRERGTETPRVKWLTGPMCAGNSVCNLGQHSFSTLGQAIRCGKDFPKSFRLNFALSGNFRKTGFCVKHDKLIASTFIL